MTIPAAEPAATPDADLRSLLRECDRAVATMRAASLMLRHPSAQLSREVVAMLARLDVGAHRLVEGAEAMAPWLDDGAADERRAALDHRGQP